MLSKTIYKMFEGEGKKEPELDNFVAYDNGEYFPRDGHLFWAGTAFTDQTVSISTIVGEVIAGANSEVLGYAGSFDIGLDYYCTVHYVKGSVGDGIKEYLINMTSPSITVGTDNALPWYDVQASGNATFNEHFIFAIYKRNVAGPVQITWTTQRNLNSEPNSLNLNSEYYTEKTGGLAGKRRLIGSPNYEYEYEVTSAALSGVRTASMSITGQIKIDYKYRYKEYRYVDDDYDNDVVTITEYDYKNYTYNFSNPWNYCNIYTNFPSGTDVFGFTEDIIEYLIWKHQHSDYMAVELLFPYDSSMGTAPKYVIGVYNSEDEMIACTHYKQNGTYNFMPGFVGTGGYYSTSPRLLQIKSQSPYLKPETEYSVDENGYFLLPSNETFTVKVLLVNDRYVTTDVQNVYTFTPIDLEPEDMVFTRTSFSGNTANRIVVNCVSVEYVTVKPKFKISVVERSFSVYDRLIYLSYVAPMESIPTTIALIDGDTGQQQKIETEMNLDADRWLNEGYWNDIGDFSSVTINGAPKRGINRECRYEIYLDYFVVSGERETLIGTKDVTPYHGDYLTNPIYVSVTSGGNTTISMNGSWSSTGDVNGIGIEAAVVADDVVNNNFYIFPHGTEIGHWNTAIGAHLVASSIPELNILNNDWFYGYFTINSSMGVCVANYTDIVVNHRVGGFYFRGVNGSYAYQSDVVFYHIPISYDRVWDEVEQIYKYNTDRRDAAISETLIQVREDLSGGYVTKLVDGDKYNSQPGRGHGIDINVVRDIDRGYVPANHVQSFVETGDSLKFHGYIAVYKDSEGEYHIPDALRPGNLRVDYNPFNIVNVDFQDEPYTYPVPIQWGKYESIRHDASNWVRNNVQLYKNFENDYNSSDIPSVQNDT